MVPHSPIYQKGVCGMDTTTTYHGDPDTRFGRHQSVMNLMMRHAGVTWLLQ